ncbi:MAG: hypothetical protein ACR2N7_08425, partial [Acidimicrobiia bacterium]
MALGTAAYGLLAGLSAGIGFLFLVLGIRKGWRFSPEHAVGILGLVASAGTLVTLALHSADTAAEYQSILHGPFTLVGIGALVVVAWTVGVTDRAGYPRIPIALTGFAMISLAVDALTSGAFIADEVTGLRQVSLFGETFVVHTPASSS